jgi:hypothetical protein
VTIIEVVYQYRNRRASTKTIHHCITQGRASVLTIHASQIDKANNANNENKLDLNNANYPSVHHKTMLTTMQTKRFGASHIDKEELAFRKKRQGRARASHMDKAEHQCITDSHIDKAELEQQAPKQLEPRGGAEGERTKEGGAEELTLLAGREGGIAQRETSSEEQWGMEEKQQGMVDRWSSEQQGMATGDGGQRMADRRSRE